jgi:hypothetical protein
MAAKTKIEFFFEESVVGYFEEPPSSPGRLNYMPYRGIGYHRLIQALVVGSATVLLPCYW